MINKRSLNFLNNMFNMELEQFLVNQEGSYGTLSKQSRIQECFQSIITYIVTKHSAKFIIQNNDKSLTMILDTAEDIDNIYLITISDSCETYQVDEVIIHEEPILRNIKQFNKSKI